MDISPQLANAAQSAQNSQSANAAQFSQGIQASNNAPERQPQDQQRVSASDFMELLMTQLQNQDPLNPMEDKDFMAQMAQFSSLEEMSNLNTTMTDFTQRQQAQNASAYLGREVTVVSPNGGAIEGLVSAVNRKGSDDGLSVTVNGQDFDVNRIKSVRLPETQS